MVESPGKVQAKYYATEVGQASCVHALKNGNNRSVRGAYQKGLVGEDARKTADAAMHIIWRTTVDANSIAQRRTARAMAATSAKRDAI